MLNKKNAVCLGVVIGTMLPMVSMSESLKKQREWPSAMPQISAQLKEQYEYDPEAGAGSNKLLSVTVVNAARESKYQAVTVFRDGSPTEWEGRDLMTGKNTPYVKTLWAYHGYGALFISAENPVEQLVFEPSEKWPARQFKVLTAFRDGMKFMFSCEMKSKVSASTVFPQLPGGLYTYDCSSRTNSVYASANGWVTSVYSDYLDIQVASEINKNKTPDMTVFQGSSVETTIRFYDLKGVVQSIVTRDVR